MNWKGLTPLELEVQIAVGTGMKTLCLGLATLPRHDRASLVYLGVFREPESLELPAVSRVKEVPISGS